MTAPRFLLVHPVDAPPAAVWEVLTDIAGTPQVLTVDDAAELRGTTDDFVLTVLSLVREQRLTRPGPLTALCTSGTFTLDTGAQTVTLRQGEAVFVGADEARPAVTGEGALFVASTALTA